MTSVSEVDWQIAPSRMRPSRKRQGVGEIAVMADGKAAPGDLREQRLHIAQHGLARRRIAIMADRVRAGQIGDDAFIREGVADEAKPSLGMKAHAVKSDDARRFLATMLKRVQAERGDRRSIRMAKNPEDTAFLAQPVGIIVHEGLRNFQSVRLREAQITADIEGITRRAHAVI